MTRVTQAPFAKRHPDPFPRKGVRVGLVLLLAIYIVIGGMYALKTPLWQVPDEPAHVNYALHIARTGRLPTLQPGDYDPEYLEAIKAAKFPPHMSVASIRYEFHQPPAYYLLAAPLIRLLAPAALDPHADGVRLAGAVHTMRFLSLILSVGLLLTAFAVARHLFPDHPTLALATVAFIAFIPQHVAMMAGANNDALAELMLALFLYLLVVHMGYPVEEEAGSRRWVLRGILLGLVLWSKTTIYAPAGLALLAFHLLRAWPEGGRKPRWREEGLALVQEAGLGVLLALPFFWHNVRAYGWPDILGWRRHGQIVVGQMTTAEYIARHGWAAYLHRALTWTFRSFWGQFGWMGVLLDARLYTAFLYLTLLLFLGIGVFLVHGCRPRFERVILRRPSTAPECLIPYQHNALGVLSASAVGTWVAYVGYNVTFLQHQGRYLFTGLVPLAVISLPGLWILLERRYADRGMKVASSLGWMALLLAAANVGPLTRWDALSLFGVAFWFGFARQWPRRRPLWLLLPFLLLIPLDVWILYRVILPALAVT